MAEIAKLSPKFQVTIPTNIRQTLELNAGDRLLFHVNRDGEVVIRAVKHVSAKDLAGSMRKAITESETSQTSLDSKISDIPLGKEDGEQ